MPRLSRQQLWTILAAVAGGIGLIAILALALPRTAVQESDLEGTVEAASAAETVEQAPAPASPSPVATDGVLLASAPTSTATATATATATSTPRPTATATSTPAPTSTPTPTSSPTSTPTEAPTNTPPPAPTATPTPSPTAAPLPTVTPAAAAGGAIIVDHTCTDIGRIPDQWLAEAKELAILYGHTSHGLQLMEGAAALEERDARYGFGHFYAGPELPRRLPSMCAGVLCIYSADPTDVTFWSTEEGRNRVRAAASTGLFDFGMWSWCGEQSTNETATVQQYLDTMRVFEGEYPGMRFVLMTGHTDGGSARLQQNNDLVRQFARTNGMVLYDFADIESHDPDGNYHPTTDDDCSWCAQWCSTHPEDCSYLPDSCQHSHPFNCLRKANAFWWMMARLAGWDGR